MPHALRILAAFLTVSASILAQEGCAKTLTSESITRQATTPGGHRIEAAADGARILCQMQDLEGHLTGQGLTIRSVDDGEPGACAMRTRAIGRSGSEQAVGPGQVVVDGSSANLIRPGLVESITTTSDGIRQDWIIHSRPPGHGSLTLDLDLTGAAVGTIADDQLALTMGGGRRLVWRNLDVFDAHEQRLPARFLVENDCLRIAVDDATAVYPVRIDPTYTDADWTSMGTSSSKHITAVAIYDGALVIGGNFSEDGFSILQALARWDGASWQVWQTLPSGYITALAVNGSDLYVAGAFSRIAQTEANNLAKWDGHQWHNLGTGVNGEIKTLAFLGNDLVAGGSFSAAGGSVAANIAKWDGLEWAPLGDGLNSRVLALTTSGSELYAAGDFTTAGSVEANHVARWDGLSWSNLGAGCNGRVLALAVSGSFVYAGGYFDSAGGIPVNYIAKWDGGTWSPLGSGVGSPNSGGIVKCMTVSDGNIIVAGHFLTAGGVNVNSIARWDGNTWNPLGSGSLTDIYALTASGSTIYIGHNEGIAGRAPYASRWDGSSWTPLGQPSAFSEITCSTVHRSEFYAGGKHASSGQYVSRIAKWDGTSWSIVGTMYGEANSLASSQFGLVLGGSFTAVDNVSASNIAYWDGRNWAPLGNGVNGRVYVVTARDAELFAGGSFTSAGLGPANRIARWDGGSWHPLGSGFDGEVLAIAPSGPNLIAGGYFTSAGDITVNRIASWDGVTWNAMGAGMDSTVRTLATSGHLIYAGGEFIRAGDEDCNHIAQWDGSTWRSLQSGPNGIKSGISTIALSGEDLFAGGTAYYIYTPESTLTESLAHWDGSGWKSLGSGTNRTVRTLAVSDAHLFAAGNFSIAGGLWSAGGAYMTLKSRAVTYHPNGATAGYTPVAQSKHPGIPIFIAGNTGRLAKPGATFLGWNTTAVGNGAAYQPAATYTIDQSMTLYAQWQSDTYAVTYHANGADRGVIPASQFKVHDLDLQLADNSGSLVRHGYAFAGWNSSPAGIGSAYQVQSYYTTNAPVTLYAQWTPDVYQVTYHGNGAKEGSVPANQYKTHGVDLIVAGNTGNLVKTGMRFTGWNTTADGSGTAIATGGILASNTSTTLYAQWIPATYTISYAANGATGGNVPADQIKTHDITLVLAGNSGFLLKDGSLFSGWNTQANGGGVTYGAGGSYTANADLTLYAQWASIPAPTLRPADAPFVVPGPSSSGCGLGGIGALLATAGLAVISARRRRR